MHPEQPRGDPMSRRSILLALAAAAALDPGARAIDRLLVLDRWQSEPGQLFSIARRNLFDPLTPVSSIAVSTIGTIWSMPAPALDIHSLAVHPTNGQLYTVARFNSVAGVINAMVAIDRDTGALTYVGAPSLDTARFRFEPVTLQFHWVNGASSRIYSTPGGSGSIQPNLAFVAGDAHEGVIPNSAGFAFVPPPPGATHARALLIDSATDSLCEVDFATSELRTIGALGVDVTTAVAGPVIELDGAVFFAADLGAGARLFSVDPETGAATDAGGFPDLHGVTDMVLDPDLTGADDLDGDGYPNLVEIAAGSSPGNPAAVPFADFPTAPAALAAPSIEKSLKIQLDFSAANGDVVIWKGRLPVPDGFTPGGKQLIAELGGYAVSFTLGKKGKGIALDAGAVIELGKKVKNGSVSFKLKLQHAAIAAYLADEGLIDADLAASPVVVPVALWMPGVTYETTVALSYSATAGDSGWAQE